MEDDPRPGGRLDKVILISVDTLRADFLGCYNPAVTFTPNLDEFAAEAALFLDVLSQAPSTTISHKSILYSLYPSIHKTTSSSVPTETRPSPLEALQAQGLLTAGLVGGGKLARELGFDRGFDSYWYPEPREDPDTLMRQVETLERAALPWLEEHDDESFFLFLHTYQPHAPYLAPHAYLGRHAGWYEGDLGLGLLGHDYNRSAMSEDDGLFVRDLYAAEVEYTDASLGRIFDKLKELGIYDETLIVFLSDHGESLGERGHWGHSRLYNVQLRVPLMIRVPGMGPARVAGPVETVDVMPTIFSALGLTHDLPFQGRDLMAAISGYGRLEPGRCRIAEQGRRASVQDGEWKAIFPVGDTRSWVVSEEGGLMIVEDGKWKAVFLAGGTGGRLYDRLEDPDETRDLASARPKILRRLLKVAQRRPDVAELYNLVDDPEEVRNLAAERPEIVRRLRLHFDEMVREGASTAEGFVITKSSKPTLDEQTTKDLKALGYIE